MKNINNEKDLEFYYRNFFEKHLGVETTAINNTDSVFEYKGTRVLIEIKFKVPFNKENISRTLAQAIYYCKRFESNLDTVPSIIFIGNEDEFVYFDYDEYEQFLKDYSVDWLIPPSTVFQSKNNILVKKIKQNIQNYRKENINKLSKFVDYLRKYFKKYNSKIVVYKESFIDFYKKFSELFRKCDHKMVNLVFFTYLLSKDKIMKKENDVVVENIITGLSWRKFKSFFNQYDLSKLRKEDIISFYDIMKNKEDRILSGSFYTPTYITRIVIEAMKKYVDENFMEKYVIWDPACGTGNLTRGYKFKKLFLSTNDDLELKLMEYAGTNPEAIKFKYDFVSEMDVSFIYKKEFKELRNAIEKGNLIFYLNPPFVGLSGAGFKLKNGRNKWNDNPVIVHMKKELKVGRYDLALLFLFKIMKIAQRAKKNVYVCFFSDASLLIKKSRMIFSKEFMKNFEHVYSLLFNSEDFGITPGWEIQFSIMKFNFSKKHRKVSFHGHKLLFNYLKDIAKVVPYSLRLNDESLTNKTNDELIRIKVFNIDTRIPKSEFLFFIGSFTDPIRQSSNQNYVLISSRTFCVYSITPSTYWKAMIYCGVTSYFVYPFSTVRTRFPRTKDLEINNKRRFIEHVLDCTVLTVFGKTSIKPCRNSTDFKLESSASEIGWNGTFKRRFTGWDVINHMFPFSTDAVKKKAKKYNFEKVVEDCVLNYELRYTYTKLKKFEKYLSKEARLVLMRAARLYLILLKSHDNDFFEGGFDNIRLKSKKDEKFRELLLNLGKKVYEDSQKFKTLV